MAQMTNVKGIKIYNKIKELYGIDEANEFAASLPLSKSADYIRKFKWAKDVCNYLESKYTYEQIKKLRMGCSCIASDNDKQNTKQMYNEANSFEEFCENYNSLFLGKRFVWYNESAFYFSYPSCYCSCVKRVNETISPTWCLCTLGYVKDLFDFVFEYDNEVSLIESIKLGDNRCVMSITMNR